MMGYVTCIYVIGSRMVNDQNNVQGLKLGEADWLGACGPRKHLGSLLYDAVF